MVTKVKCPTCQSEVEWGPQSPFRPFCSKRCQLIDLGEWADEEKRIPGRSTRICCRSRKRAISGYKPQITHLRNMKKGPIGPFFMLVDCYRLMPAGLEAALQSGHWHRGSGSYAALPPAPTDTPAPLCRTAHR